MAVLVRLADAEGAVVSRNELLDTVWPRMAVTQDALSQCVVELRKAFRDDSKNARVIETIPKIGLRLMEPVATVQASSTATHRKSARVVRGDIRFCTTADGYRLAYSRLGRGRPLIRTGNWVSHIEAEWDSPTHSPLLRDLSHEFDLVIYDSRGTGLSDRNVSEFSLETMVADMGAVADANRLDKFSILAYSQSCAVAVIYAVRNPGRVSRMVLYGGFLHNFRTETEIDAMANLFRESWGQSNPATRQLFTTALFPDSTREEFEGFNELQRHAVSPEMASRLFKACHSFDVRELAKRVTVPTLVMHSRYEPGVPAECSREMASLIPGARLVMLDSKNHLVLEREPAYREFIDETVAFVNAGQ